MADPWRPRRILWIVGILLLAATALGAGVVLNNNSSQPSVDGTKDNDVNQLPAIISIGYVDVQPGVINLYPVQQGRVIETAQEGTFAKKGKVLLRLDDRLARLQVAEATAAHKAALGLLSTAENAPKQHEEKIKQQNAAVAAARHQRSAAAEDLKIKEKAYEDKIINIHQKNAAEELVKKLDAIIAGEEGKLRELKLVDPQIAIDRANADVAAKLAKLDQAKLALQECELIAPSDGTVLRVFSHPGEILTANPKAPAMQFAPKGPLIVRAEVMQEWASKVELNKPVVIEDDTFAGPQWKGKVVHISDYFTQKRSRILEPFMYNDVRTLEVIVEVTPNSENYPLRIGQRVRVTIR